MKVLLVRLSSIGDIVLTSPVVRCLKLQQPDIIIHFITKKQFKKILDANPYIDKIYTMEKSINEVIPELKQENYDYIIDLHKNIRSIYLRLRLGVKSKTFYKLNFEKFLLVRFKINILPNIHIVDRYLEAVKFLGIINDNNGLDYFISKADEVDIETIPLTHQHGYVGIVISSIHKTKQLPEDKIINLCQNINHNIVLLGGKEDFDKGERIKNRVGNKIFNACGKFNISQSAFLVQQAKLIISNDTGLMHIAAAYKKRLITVWGNTLPEFGMYPYMPDEDVAKSTVFEVKNLKCRPCSKLGFDKCPKAHFNCMNLIDVDSIAKLVNEL